MRYERTNKPFPGMPFPDLYLTGRAGSGKDTQAAWLVDRLGYTRIALADPLKELAAKWLGVSVLDINNEKKKYRSFLIGIGQGARDWKMAWVGSAFIPRKIRVRLFYDWLLSFGLPLSNEQVFDGAVQGWGHKDYWLRRFLVKYRVLESVNGGPVVVTDCRMPNEVNFFRNLDFKGIRLSVDDEVVKSRLYKRDGTTDFSFFTNETEKFAGCLEVDWVVDGEAAENAIFLDICDYLTGRA